MKTMGAIAGLMKDKERLKAVGDEVKANLERARVEGSAGGGAVRVIMSGRMRVLDVRLDSAMLVGASAGDESRDMAQDLIAEATNDALEKVQSLVQQEVGRAARELGLPEIPGLGNLLTGG